jgi:predicted secreted hydrolase
MKRFVIAVALLASSIGAQDFGGFDYAKPGRPFTFPADHGSHEEFRTEWWYFTGNLRTTTGRELGYEVTFFRVGVVPPSVPRKNAWDLRNVALAHFAVSDISGRKFRFYERTNRASSFTANAAAGRLDVFNGNWTLRQQPDGAWRLRASEGRDAIDLTMRSRKPPAIHGTDNISVKASGAGYASHYYSMTRLVTSGSVTIDGELTQAGGLSWMDHEFGSAVLRENQSGWDWFSMQLDDETELMLYQIRTTAGAADVTSSGSLIAKDGSVTHLRHSDFSIVPLGTWRSSRSGATYPMGWRLSVPSRRIQLEVRERMRDQELDTSGSTGITYWEGAVSVRGSAYGREVRGSGYVELTGYDKAFRMRNENQE